MIAADREETEVEASMNIQNFLSGNVINVLDFLFIDVLLYVPHLEASVNKKNLRTQSLIPLPIFGNNGIYIKTYNCTTRKMV